MSHAHYDHCDKTSIKLLVDNNPQEKILTGLKLDNIISILIVMFGQRTDISNIRVITTFKLHFCLPGIGPTGTCLI